ncbi:MAG: hypothetical protein WAL85_16915 [Candidatus Korobacteraceae bacterium]
MVATTIAVARTITDSISELQRRSPVFAALRTLAILGCVSLLVPCLLGQNWKQVHRADDAKWAKATGLDPITVHKIWRAASNVPEEKDDDSRIANLDLTGLAERHHVLLVTYAGEKNCLTITVFRQLSDFNFSKLWSVEHSPDGTSFCDAAFGSAYAGAQDGVINVRVPTSAADSSVKYVIYAYDWNGITYRFAGEKEVQGR